MPFISSTTDAHRNQARELQANRKHLQAQQKLDQENREFWFKFKYGACLLAAVGIGAFLFAVLVTL